MNRSDDDGGWVDDPGPLPEYDDDEYNGDYDDSATARPAYVRQRGSAKSSNQSQPLAHGSQRRSITVAQRLLEQQRQQVLNQPPKGTVLPADFNPTARYKREYGLSRSQIQMTVRSNRDPEFTIQLQRVDGPFFRSHVEWFKQLQFTNPIFKQCLAGCTESKGSSKKPLPEDQIFARSMHHALINIDHADTVRGRAYHYLDDPCGRGLKEEEDLKIRIFHWSRVQQGLADQWERLPSDVGLGDFVLDALQRGMHEDFKVEVTNNTASSSFVIFLEEVLASPNAHFDLFDANHQLIYRSWHIAKLAANKWRLLPGGKAVFFLQVYGHQIVNDKRPAKTPSSAAPAAHASTAAATSSTAAIAAATSREKSYDRIALVFVTAEGSDRSCRPLSVCLALLRPPFEVSNLPAWTKAQTHAFAERLSLDFENSFVLHGTAKPHRQQIDYKQTQIRIVMPGRKMCPPLDVAVDLEAFLSDPHRRPGQRPRFSLEAGGFSLREHTTAYNSTNVLRKCKYELSFEDAAGRMKLAPVGRCFAVRIGEDPELTARNPNARSTSSVLSIPAAELEAAAGRIERGESFLLLPAHFCNTKSRRRNVIFYEVDPFERVDDCWLVDAANGFLYDYRLDERPNEEVLCFYVPAYDRTAHNAVCAWLENFKPNRENFDQRPFTIPPIVPPRLTGERIEDAERLRRELPPVVCADLLQKLRDVVKTAKITKLAHERCSLKRGRYLANQMRQFLLTGQEPELLLIDYELADSMTEERQREFMLLVLGGHYDTGLIAILLGIAGSGKTRGLCEAGMLNVVLHCVAALSKADYSSHVAFFMAPTHAACRNILKTLLSRYGLLFEAGAFGTDINQQELFDLRPLYVLPMRRLISSEASLLPYVNLRTEQQQRPGVQERPKIFFPTCHVNERPGQKAFCNGDDLECKIEVMTCKTYGVHYAGQMLHSKLLAIFLGIDEMSQCEFSELVPVFSSLKSTLTVGGGDEHQLHVYKGGRGNQTYYLRQLTADPNATLPMDESPLRTMARNLPPECKFLMLDSWRNPQDIGKLVLEEYKEPMYRDVKHRKTVQQANDELGDCYALMLDKFPGIEHHSILLRHTDRQPAYRTVTGSLVNHAEAMEVESFARMLTAPKEKRGCGVPTESIRVLSPYLAQVRHLQALFGPTATAIPVETVDCAQGGQAQIIILSLTRSADVRKYDPSKHADIAVLGGPKLLNILDDETLEDDGGPEEDAMPPQEAAGDESAADAYGCEEATESQGDAKKESTAAKKSQADMRAGFFMEDTRRMVTTCTRPQCKLVIFGQPAIISQLPILHKLRVNENCVEVIRRRRRGET